MSENKLQNKDFRLQFLTHDEIFPSREKAVNYINDFFKPEALLSEPAVAYYGDAEAPNMLLAVGSGERKVFIIDFAEVSEKMNALEEKSSEEGETLKNVLDAVESIRKSCGLFYDENKVKDKISYKPDKDDKVLRDAETLAEAIKLLSEFVQDENTKTKLFVSDTKSIKLTYDDNAETGGKTLRAYTKISVNGEADEEDFNNNIIGLKNDGIYASAHLEYNEDKNQLIFSTSGKKDGRFKDDAFKQVVELGKHSEVLADNTENNPVKISINNEGSVKKVSGSIKLSEKDNNIIRIQDGALLVDGKASNIKFKDTTVANELNKLGDAAKKLDEKATLIKTDSDTIDLKINENVSGNTVISADVKRSKDNTLIVSEGGLSVNMGLSIDTASNALLLKLGDKVKEIALPKIDLSNIVTNVYYDKDQRVLTITFNNGQQAAINIANMLTPYSFYNGADSPITLTEIANPANGTSTIKAGVRLKSVDNLLTSENGELWVSKDAIDVKIDNKVKPVNDNLSNINTALNNKIDEAKVEILEKVNVNKETVDAELASIKSINTEQTERLNTIDNTLTEVGKDIDSLSKDSVDLRGKVGENKDAIVSLSSDNEVNKTNISTLKENVAKNSTDITDEINRAKKEEKEISDLANQNKAAIIAEADRATAAESVLANRVKSNEDILSTLNGASTADGSISKMISVAVDDLETQTDSKILHMLGDAKSYTDSEIVKVKNELGEESADKANNALVDSKAYTNEKIVESKEYADNKVREESNRAKAAEKANADAITDLQNADKVIDTKLEKKIENVELASNGDLSYVLKVDGKDCGSFIIPKDQFLKEVTYDSSSKKLHFVFIIEGGNMATTDIDISHLVDVYTAGNGLSLEKNKFTVKLATGSESYLTVTEDGLMLQGIDAKANSSDVYSKTEVYTKDEADDKFLTQEQANNNLATKEVLSTLSDRVSLIKTEVDKNTDYLKVVKGNESEEGSIANAIKVANAYTDEKTGVNTAAINVLNGNEAEVGSVKKALKDANLYTDTKVAEAVQVEHDARQAEDVRLNELINGLSTSKANASDVYTKDQIEAKGYLTEHQDISSLATKADVESVKFIPVESSTVKTVLKQTGSVKELESNVKISDSNNNIIKFNNNGIYANVSYNSATNTLTFNSGESAIVIKLSDHSLVSEGYYDSSTKSIILILDKEGGSERIVIPVGDLVNTWEPDNTDSVITLDKTPNAKGIDILTARLNISTVSTNALNVDEKNALYVPNMADFYTASYGDSTRISVQEAIGKLKEKTDKVDGIESDINQLKIDVNENKNNITNLNTQLTILNSVVNINKETIKTLGDRVSVLEGKFNAYDGRIEALEAAVDGIKSSIGSNTETDSILGRLAKIEDALSKLIDLGTYTTE